MHGENSKIVSLKMTFDSACQYLSQNVQSNTLVPLRDKVYFTGTIISELKIWQNKIFENNIFESLGKEY